VATPDYDQQMKDLDEQIEEARAAYAVAYKANDPMIGTPETAEAKKQAAAHWNDLSRQWNTVYHDKARAHRDASRTIGN
jgi:hypothetical protein